MVEITLPIVLQILQTVGILVGILYYLFIMRNSQKNQQHSLETRQAQLYMQLYSFYDNKEFLKDYGNITNVYVYKDVEDWWRKYSPQVDNDVFASWLRVGRFFDGVGILLKRNLIEKDLIFELLGDVIRGSWEGNIPDSGMRKWLEGGRELWDRPLLWHNFEYLYNELMRWTKEQHPELKA